MAIENLGSLLYRADRDMVYYTKPAQIRVFERYGKGAIKRALETTCSNLISILPEGSDVHLEGCLVTGNVLRRYLEENHKVLNVLLYPSSGKIRFKLKRTGKFSTNLHQQKSSIIITEITNLRLKNNNESRIWLPGNNDVGNEIKGVLLFNENPFDNPPKYFEEVINYDPIYIK